MADTTSKTKTQKKGFFQGLKSEFNKIIWTDASTLAKQTALVVVISLVLGVLISVIDSAVLQGLNFLVK